MNHNQALNTVRKCKNRYLIYFAFTTLNIKPGGYKEDKKYSINTTYDIFSSDSFDDIKEHKDILLSLVSKINSYALVIVDRVETKVLKRVLKLVNIEAIFEEYEIKDAKIKSDLRWSCKDQNKCKKISPCLNYDWDNKLAELDFFFRGPLEVPENYNWDIGEYDGWLQFRWGDGKNKIIKENE